MEELDRVEGAMETYKTWGAIALRAECWRQKVTPSSLNKASYLALRAAVMVAETIQATDVVQNPFQQGAPDRRTVECMFRLLNVLFSDVHCERLSSLGDFASREALDTRTIGSGSAMWQNVTADYNDEDNETFNVLLHIKNEFTGVDAANFRPHDSAKLWVMWKQVTSKYREVFANFTKSGNHKPFEAFHGGRVDVFYLHLVTTITRPNLHQCVIHLLPESVAYDSIKTAATVQESAAKSTQARNGKRSDGVVEVLREIVKRREDAIDEAPDCVFYESIALKRQKDARSKAEHEVTMRAAAVREKKDGVELLISLQRSVSDMRCTLAQLMQAGLHQDDVEVADLQRCIAKPRSEMDVCL